jgi:aromatic ring-opening dioxygenase LigB subunit
MKPDTVVLLTGYGSVVPEVVNTNIASSLRCCWPDDLTAAVAGSRERIKGDVEFSAHLKEVIDTDEQGVPMTIIAESKIEPQITAPLSILLAHLPETKAVVMSTQGLSTLENYLFGEFLDQQILQTNKRVAVIAAGHLANHAAATVSGQTESFDTMIVDFLKQDTRDQILRINEDLIAASQSDLFNPLAILLGVIGKVSVDTEVLAYESQFGEGQLVANFVLK